MRRRSLKGFELAVISTDLPCPRLPESPTIAIRERVNHPRPRIPVALIVYSNTAVCTRHRSEKQSAYTVIGRRNDCQWGIKQRISSLFKRYRQGPDLYAFIGFIGPDDINLCVEHCLIICVTYQ